MTKLIIVIKEIKVDALPRVVGVGGDPPGVPVYLDYLDYLDCNDDEYDYDNEIFDVGGNPGLSGL